MNLLQGMQNHIAPASQQAHRAEHGAQAPSPRPSLHQVLVYAWPISSAKARQHAQQGQRAQPLIVQPELPLRARVGVEGGLPRRKGIEEKVSKSAWMSFKLVPLKVVAAWVHWQAAVWLV